MKTLLVYGTRYGATATTAREIARVLGEQGFDVKIANAKEEKIKDTSPYDLIIAGTGLQFARWTGEVEGFLKKHQKALAEKKVAIYVSTMKSLLEREGKTKELIADRKLELDNKVAKYSFNPLSLGFFGGIIDFNKMGFVTRKMSGSIKQRLEKAGFKETAPKVYELRDWEEIRLWTKDLADKAKQ
jgi:menaquinone-dependent protoporphyrinogen IX oxidase